MAVNIRIRARRPRSRERLRLVERSVLLLESQCSRGQITLAKLRDTSVQQ